MILSDVFFEATTCLVVLSTPVECRAIKVLLPEWKAKVIGEFPL